MLESQEGFGKDTGRHGILPENGIRAQLCLKSDINQRFRLENGLSVAEKRTSLQSSNVLGLLHWGDEDDCFLGTAAPLSKRSVVLLFGLSGHPLLLLPHLPSLPSPPYPSVVISVRLAHICSYAVALLKDVVLLEEVFQ